MASPPPDERESAVLAILKRDPLASTRSIAQQLQLSATQVTTIVRRIQSEHNAHVVLILDNTSFGYRSGMIVFKVRGRRVADVAQELSGIHWIQYLVGVTGRDADLIAFVRTPLRDQFGHLFEYLSTQIDGLQSADYRIFSDPINYDAGLASYFLGSARPPSSNEVIPALEDDHDTDLIDDVDRLIIGELQLDGRMTSQAIAAKHQLNSGTVRYRIKNLQQKGIMRFVTVMDPRYLDLNTVAVLEIAVEFSRLDEAASALRAHSSVPYLFIATGSATLVGAAIVGDISVLADFIERQQGSNGIISIRAHLVVNSYKTDPRWGYVRDRSLP